MSALPLKIVLFVAQPWATPVIEFLAGKGFLAGVVIPPRSDMYLHQLKLSLTQLHIPCHELSDVQDDTTLGLLRKWEADLVIAIGFSGAVPLSFSQATRLGFYNLHPVDPGQFSGAFPLYWSVRQGTERCCAVLQRVDLPGGQPNIAGSTEYAINHLDTYKLAENKLAVAAVKCVEQFVSIIELEGNLPAFSQQEGEPVDAPLPEENMLLVDFHRMNSQQVVDLARAGNPLFNGCLIKLGQTMVNLLQATCVSFPTHGVSPGTICHSGDPGGLIVATTDGAVRLDVIANVDGIFGAEVFAERFQVSAGMSFNT